MPNANPIPTAETLIRQVGRHLAMTMGINAAVPYVANAAGFPRGVGLIDPELPDGSDVFRGRGALWARSIPDAAALRARGGTSGGAGFNLSLTSEAVPSPASGIDTPYRMIGVRFYVQAADRTTCVEVLSEVASVFALPGYSADGRRWWRAQAGMSVEALAAMGGQSVGIIGVPPPESIPAGGSPVWRVIAVDEYAPVQVLSDEIGAAQGSSVAGASNMVSCTMTLAFMVVPAALATPTKAFEVWLPLGALPGVAGNDAAVRVFRASDGSVKIETGQFASVGAAHTYATYSASTVGGIVTAMGVPGWQNSAALAGALTRPAADLVLMDWRRARSTSGTGGATVKAAVYVHGSVAGGGGGG